MQNLPIVALVAVLYQLIAAPAARAYTGFHSSEATLSFEAFVDVDSRKKPSPSEARDAVTDHVQYLFGPMGTSPTLAAPKGDEKTEVTSIEENEDGFRVHYKYTGTLVLQNGPRTRYEVMLPNNPHALYVKTTPKKGLNPCTDPDYQTEGDFWYFWSPLRKGCKKLIKPDVDYQVFEADLERIPNVRNSRPEYERLADADGEIRISLLMGMNDASMSPDPIASEKDKKHDDLNAANYRGIRKRLIEQGFEARAWSHAEIRKVVLEDTRPLPHVEELVQTYDGAGSRAKRVVVLMFFGKTQIDEASKAFHYFLRDGLRNSAVVIYDGHSGLGSNLDLPSLERETHKKFTPNKDRYQIFYFNSCSSFAYYNDMFFNRKKSDSDPSGTKNLDIVTTGSEAPFDASIETDFDTILAIHSFARQGNMQGYDSLIKRLENDDLTGVNGNEDNPSAEQR